MHGLFHFAYLDAGTGSLIVQSIIGVFAAVGVFGRRAISKVVHTLFRHGKPTGPTAKPAIVKPATTEVIKPKVATPTVKKPTKKAK